MSKFAVILPAAGKSTRFSEQRKKVFVELKGRPIWVRTAEQFVNRSDVVQTIVVIAPDDLEWFKEKYRPNLAFMDLEVVAGGTDRAESVRNGLAKVRADIDFVAVHDAARPLIVKEWIDQVFREAEQHDAAILATPVTSTPQTGRRESVRSNPRSTRWRICGPLRLRKCFDANYSVKAFAASRPVQSDR